MAKQKKGYRIDMLNGPLAGRLLLFALPLMASSLLQLLFNAADVIVVGRYAGKEALAAVGSTTSLINLFLNLFIGISVGTNVTVARDLGAGRSEDVGRSVHTSISLALISGIVLLIAGVTLSHPMLVLMSTPGDVIDLSTLYLRIYFCGTPASMLYNFGSAILRAQGDTRRPLYFLSAAGVINVMLNLVFVIAFDMSVAGVALATIISQYVSAILVIRTLMRDDGLLKLKWRQLCLDKQVVLRILRVGLPAGLQSLVFSLSNVVIQSSINSFNSTAIVAGSSASANIEGFVYAAINAFYQTALTFVSQNYGAHKCKRVDRIALLCEIYGVAIGVVLGSLCVFFGPQLAGLYAPGEPDVIAAAMERLRIICVGYGFCAVMDVTVGVMRGIGFSIVPMIVSLLGACGLRLVWIATIFQIYHTPQMLFASYPVSWLITALTHVGFFFLVRKHAYSKAAGLEPIREG